MVRRAPACVTGTYAGGRRHSVTSIIAPASAADGSTKWRTMPALHWRRTSIEQRGHQEQQPDGEQHAARPGSSARRQGRVSGSRFLHLLAVHEEEHGRGDEEDARHLASTGKSAGHPGQDEPPRAAGRRCIAAVRRRRTWPRNRMYHEGKRRRIHREAPHHREQVSPPAASGRDEARRSSRARQPSEQQDEEGLARRAKVVRPNACSAHRIQVRKAAGVDVDEVVMRHLVLQHALGALRDGALVVGHPPAAEAGPAVCRDHQRHRDGDGDAGLPASRRRGRRRRGRPGDRHARRNDARSPMRATKCSERSKSADAGHG